MQLRVYTDGLYQVNALRDRSASVCRLASLKRFCLISSRELSMTMRGRDLAAISLASARRSSRVQHKPVALVDRRVSNFDQFFVGLPISF